MEKIELRRFNKEQLHERRLLLCDPFLIPGQRLLRKLKKRELSKITINIIYTSDTIKLFNEYQFLFQLIFEIANEYKISEDQLLICLQEKKHSNEELIQINKLKIFANNRAISKDYHLNEFIESQAMHPLNSNSFSILQPAFAQFCAIINHDEQVSQSKFQS